MANIKPGIYKHFKGGIVEVFGIALDSETLEKMVVYSHKDPVKGKEAMSMWVRPLKMFQENVEVNGKKIPRFEFVK